MLSFTHIKKEHKTSRLVRNIYSKQIGLRIYGYTHPEKALNDQSIKATQPIFLRPCTFFDELFICSDHSLHAPRTTIEYEFAPTYGAKKGEAIYTKPSLCFRMAKKSKTNPKGTK